VLGKSSALRHFLFHQNIDLSHPPHHIAESYTLTKLVSQLKYFSLSPA
jgi:hypothetical protein